METTLLIKYIVTNAKFATIHELITIIKAAGRRLVEAQPKGNSNPHSPRRYHDLMFEEHTVGNIVRRILRLIREEWAAAASNPPQDGDDKQEDRGKESNMTMSVKTSSKSLNPKSGRPSALESPAMRPQTLPGADSQYSLSNFVLHGRPHRDAKMFSSIFGPTTGRAESTTKSSKNAESIRPALVSAIEEVLDDLETVFDTVSSTAKDHIHSE